MKIVFIRLPNQKMVLFIWNSYTSHSGNFNHIKFFIHFWHIYPVSSNLFYLIMLIYLIKIHWIVALREHYYIIYLWSKNINRSHNFCLAVLTKHIIFWIINSDIVQNNSKENLTNDTLNIIFEILNLKYSILTDHVEWLQKCKPAVWICGCHMLT